jgi:catechol-2,3-dioxygenase
MLPPQDRDLLTQHLSDPDGNEIEIYVDVPGADWSDAEQVMAPTRQLLL